MKRKAPIFMASIMVTFLCNLFISCDGLDLEEIFINIDTTLVDSLFSNYDLDQGPGASVLIIYQRNSIFQKGYGLANLETNKPISGLTNFRLASITKQFTAMSIMILYSRGMLDYEQTLIEFFNGFPDYGNEITLRHLLNHTSGLYDYFGLISDTVTQQLNDQDVLDLMMLQHSTYFTPGSNYRYSNTGYVLLALVVERVSGQSFSEFLNKNIFSPLGMNGSLAYEKGTSEIINRAYGYNISNSDYLFNDQSITSAVLGDGGIYSSTNDMLAWDQALYTAKLIPYDILNEAFISGEVISGSKTGYGFGWRIDNFLYRERLSHSGSSVGFKNIYHRYPNEELSIIIFTNRTTGDLKDIANKISKSLF